MTDSTLVTPETNALWPEAADAYERLTEGGMLRLKRFNGPFELYAAYEFDCRDVVTLLLAGEDAEAPIILEIVLGWARQFGRAHPNPKRRELWRWLATAPEGTRRRILEAAAYR